MKKQIKNDVMERAIHEVICMCAKDLKLKSIDLSSGVLEGKLIVRINGVLLCEERCENIDIYRLADWVDIIANVDAKWQQTNSKVEKQRYVDGMVREFKKLVLQSA